MFSPCAVVVFIAQAASHPLERCEFSGLRLPKGVRGRCLRHAARWYLSQRRPPTRWNTVNYQGPGSPRGCGGDVLTIRRVGNSRSNPLSAPKTCGGLLGFAFDPCKFCGRMGLVQA